METEERIEFLEMPEVRKVLAEKGGRASDHVFEWTLFSEPEAVYLSLAVPAGPSVGIGLHPKEPDGTGSSWQTINFHLDGKAATFFFPWKHKQENVRIFFEPGFEEGTIRSLMLYLLQMFTRAERGCPPETLEPAGDQPPGKLLSYPKPN